MKFGILKDIKLGENRVICTPIEVAAIIKAGHQVLCQEGCGTGAGFDDEAYIKAGATMAKTARKIWQNCDFVAKVKEIEESEYRFLREGQIIYCCLHPAAHPKEVQALLDSKCSAFTAEDSHRHGSPNCEAAGKQGALFGLESMLTINGGKGKFVGGLAGAPAAKALILGAGTVGRGALSVLYALGAHVTVMDINGGVLKALADQYEHVDTRFCTKEAIASILPETDLIINCVKWPKQRKDFLIDREMLKTMEAGSVLVDISGDTPGAIESAHETHHGLPRYVESGVVHYCVSNIPAAVAHSVSIALAAETLPILLNILNNGIIGACVRDGYIRRSLTAHKGYLTHEETAAVQDRQWVPPERILSISDQALDPAPPATATKSNRFYQSIDL